MVAKGKDQHVKLTPDEQYYLTYFEFGGQRATAYYRKRAAVGKQTEKNRLKHLPSMDSLLDMYD